MRIDLVFYQMLLKLRKRAAVQLSSCSVDAAICFVVVVVVVVVILVLYNE